jgi:CHAT domain-containing protein/tetratricopeptide (TPR) repeat protein
LVLGLIAFAAQATAPPAELTREQKAKLAQRDRLVKFLPELVQKGQFHKAVEAQERIAALEKEVLGEADAKVIDSLQRLARGRERLVQFVQAIRVRKEVVRLQEKRLGKGHWQTTDARLALQDSRRRARMSPEDRAALLQAAADHDRVVQLHQQGRYNEAVAIAVKVLAERRQLLGEKHRAYATSLNNLALLYQEMGERGKALPLYLEARDLLRQELGEKHPDYPTSLNNLAALYKQMGEHEKALPLYLEARDLLRRELGEKHPSYASSLDNLAFLYKDMGEHRQALPLYQQALRLRKEVLGKRHPHYATNLDNLAVLYQAMGEHGKALAYAREAMGVLDSFLENNFDSLGELHRLQLIANVLRHLGVLLSLQEQGRRPAAERYSWVLAWKCRVAQRGRLDRLLLEHPQLKEPLLRLRGVRGRLARVALLTPQPKEHASWLKQLQRLTDERDRLEAGLARRSSDLPQKMNQQRLSPERLSRELPEGVAFVDLLEYTHFTPPRGGKGEFQAERRLLAFVLRRGKEPVAVSLGAMAPISAAVLRWRREVEKPPTRADRQAIARSGRTLRRLLWLPLLPHLGQAKTVIVAPDGVLCQFPLAALSGSKAGAFLIEEVALAQVASGRHLFDLLKPGNPRQAARGLLAVGGVDYGKGKRYPPLPGAKAEADRVAELFRGAFPAEPRTRLGGQEATVLAVQQTLLGKRPRFLHLATHGFFEPPERVERLLRGLAAHKDALALRQEQTTTLAGLPLLRSGLALAGANRPADDPRAPAGVLTGQDVEGLDLRGCEVAVLSACQTALGDLKGSQGVLGLQRSFHAAGVKAMVSSLWNVHDAATLELMDEFYRRLWGKGKPSRLEALRQAQLAILRDPGRVRKRTQALLAHARKPGVPEEALRGPGRLALDLPDGGKIEAAPKRSPEAWWAAFVLSGDWR